MRLSDKTLHGRTVISADGNVIGSISELFIGTSEWRVESFGIDLNKEIADRIGADRTIFHRGTIELPISFVQSVSDTVVLTIGVEQLREARRSQATDARHVQSLAAGVSAGDRDAVALSDVKSRDGIRDVEGRVGGQGEDHATASMARSVAPSAAARSPSAAWVTVMRSWPTDRTGRWR